jgi:predicted nuclease of restriction endonuclease-like (RecB) superfamily
MTKEKTILPVEYGQALSDVKQAIQKAQIKALLSVNGELTKLYWHIGQILVSKQNTEGWGAGLIEKLVEDIQREFPGIAGFSRRNIFRMQAFYLAYEKSATAVAQLESMPICSLPWGHNAVLLEKLKETHVRLWYAQQALENGWSRSILEMQIESNLHKRHGKAISNFSATLPAPHSDLAQQSFKDPYIFDFLTLHTEANERDVEQGLIDHIQKFLLELGQGFAFVSRQYHLEVSSRDYYIDLLFYHFKLRCFIVVELKNVEFKPEFAGKLNFYLKAVDNMVKSPDDKPTIGLLLCKSKDALTVEYALSDINKPIGVASYEAKLVESLPNDLRGSLPSIEEIEAELAKKDLTDTTEEINNE